MKIHFSWIPEEALKAQFEKGLGSCHQLSFGTIQDLDIDILIDGRPTQQTLLSLPRLSSLIIPYAGLSLQTLDTLRKFGDFNVFNLHHNADSTAEMAIGLMLAAAKYIEQFSTAMKKGYWSLQNTCLSNTSLKNKNVVIIGYGSIGKKVAQICRAFDMQVSILRRSSHEPIPSDICELSQKDLAHSLKAADFLQICVPLTEKTKGMIAAPEIAQLPKHAVLINTARAQIVDEKALFEALKDNEIKAAALDVWWNYPQDRASGKPTFPSQYPLHTLKNVLMTPHRAGDAGDSQLEKRRAEAIIKLVKSILSGSADSNLVCLQEGY